LEKSANRDSKTKRYTKKEVTRLLNSARAGEKTVVKKLMPIVYDEMKAIAHEKLLFERDGHTLDTTALVHETYLKLVQQEEVEWQSRTHFLAIASLAMKRILINYAQKRNAIKRGGNYSQIEIDVDGIAADSENMSKKMADEILEIDKALKKMKKFNQRGSLIVDYHFFGGMTWKEISEVMGIATITVRRSWYTARLWLRRELKKNNFSDTLTNRQ